MIYFIVAVEFGHGLEDNWCHLCTYNDHLLTSIHVSILKRISGL